MKQSTTTTQLLSAMTAERAALLDFVVMLEREQRMLIENVNDELLKLAEQKSIAALHLKGLAQTRHAILEMVIPQLSVDSIHAWLAKHCPEGLAIWQKARELAKQSQQLNSTNGELIHMKLRHNQQSLAVLSNAANRANLYGPDGQPNFAPGSGRSLGSG